MKLVSPTEHAIYAACFVTRLGGELNHERPSNFSVEEWQARAADIAAHAAELVVGLHREAVRRRR